MKKRSLISILLVLSVGFISVNAQAALVDSNTIATFADPSGYSNNPLFTVNFLDGTLNGGWAYGKTDLTLEIPYSGHTVVNGNAFHDAWFEMAEVEITDTFGNTDGGEINFYAYGATTSPLLTISFESGYVDYQNFGADGIFLADNVAITGSEITGTLSEEWFSFNFTNLAYLTDSTDWNDGFTATASFTSSAIPEPATVCLLGLCALSLIRRKKWKGGMQVEQ